MDILSMVEKAIKLYDQASDLLEKAKPSLDNIKAGDSASLEEAQDRLASAMMRAHDAHDTLEEAIHQQIGEGDGE